MSIRIIKEGKKENYRFRIVCPVCGCDFEYELADLKKEYDYSSVLTTYPAQYRYLRYVECPCCQERIVHDSETGVGEYPNKYPEIIYTSNNQDLDCETCPNKPDPNKSLTVGDIPCTWCKKNSPYCYTGDVLPKDYKGGEYKATCFAGSYKYTTIVKSDGTVETIVTEE